MSTVNGLPAFKEPPQEIIDAARKVRQWYDEQGYESWSVMGLGPAGDHTVTKLALNALWMLASPARRDAEQGRDLARMNAETVEREMKGPSYVEDFYEPPTLHRS